MKADTDVPIDPQTTRFSACLLFSANALARALTAMSEEEFGKLGLAYSHAYLLCEVNIRPGITPSELSTLLFLTPSTITRLIEKLEQKGLVTRQTEGKNTLVYPTPQGEALQPDIMATWVQMNARYSTIMPEADARMLTQQVFQAAQLLSAR